MMVANKTSSFNGRVRCRGGRMRYAPTHLRSIRWACGLDVNEVSIIKEIQRKTPANAEAFLVGQSGKNTYVEKMGGYRITPFHIWIESVNGE